MTEKVLVIYGGTSVEREVSVNSGKSCARALIKKGYNVVPYNFNGNLQALIAKIKKEKPDVVFNALHGKLGEDGTIQAVMNVLKMPYTHSGVAASAVGMNKIMAKTLFEKAGVPVAKHVVCKESDLRKKDPMKRPFVVKPIDEGSAVGVQVIKTKNDKIKKTMHKEMMVEEYIPGKELTCMVLNGKAVGWIEIVPEHDFYDYHSKYAKGGSRHVVSNDLPKEVQKKMEAYAVLAHDVLGCRGVTRSDFRYDPKTKRLVILEINTQPGMTSTSLVPDIAKAKGIGYEDLVEKLVKHAAID